MTQAEAHELGKLGRILLALAVLGVTLTFVGLFLLVRTLKGLMVHRLENLFDRTVFRNAPTGLVFGLAPAWV